MSKEELLREIDKLPLFREARVWISESRRPEESIETSYLHNLVESKRYKAIYEAPNLKEPVAIVSKYYKLIQLRDSFKRALTRLPEEIEGKINYYRGRAEMTLFPEESNIGLRVFNSVDGRGALRVDFAVRLEDNKYIVLPRRVLQGFRRVHKGRVLLKYRDFLKIVTEVRKVWTTIREKMSKKLVDDSTIKEIKKVLKAGKRLSNAIDELYEANKIGQKYYNERPLNLWTLFLAIVDKVLDRTYKSRYHRQRKLNQIARVIINYAFFLELD